MVTGAAGFIGSHLVEALRRSGRNVVGIDRREVTVRTDTPLPADAGDFHAVRCDLAKTDLSAVLINADVVFHLAAIPGVRPSWTEFPEYLHCNVLATQRLLDSCVRSGVEHVVVASSSSVYGNATRAMGEDLLPQPASPYGVTKLAAERLALAFAARADTDMSVTALRFFTVYGPGQRPDMFISRMVRAVLEDKPIQIHGDGTQRRDFVYVGDIVRALMLVGAPGRGPVESGVINVGGNDPVSLNELLALAAELTGIKPDARYGPTRLGDVDATVADLTRAQGLLGYRPETSLRDGLAAQIDWTRRWLAAGARPPAVAPTLLETAPTHPR
ncbi:NAD-dependent epimerase/dehydratase family protein [Streptomyces sp. AK02-01A]|uniref:NAD-dependent epimerase/dehydratase family protein n=1 Tax=Streptomyces sp. AK02-01A TaxID=3028648 RepID=UPI0029A4BEA9|nr:NAD-dependent epimerase/dehydratase family protein [Streptomyces sp. AK02-01A]MDX3852339.1 NAD-dependent epimerase/dehydratase family protein [Streptomyces sp. AK02-01A]